MTTSPESFALALEARTDAASPGPWSAHNRAERIPNTSDGFMYGWPVVREEGTSEAVVLLVHNLRSQDAVLAALAPDLARALAQAVRALAEIEQMPWPNSESLYALKARKALAAIAPLAERLSKGETK